MQTIQTSERGALLMEALVAMAILSVALITIIFGFGNALQANRKAQRLVTARELGRMKIEELEMAQLPSGDKVLSGDYSYYGAEYERYSWQTEFVREEEMENEKLFRVTVVVFWEPSRQEKQELLRFITCIYKNEYDSSSW